MDFQLSDEQKDIQKAAKEFAQGEFDPDLALELDQAGKFPESIWKKSQNRESQAFFHEVLCLYIDNVLQIGLHEELYPLF